MLTGIDGLSSALGLWTARFVELREEWAAGLPVGAHGVLTGDAAADGRALDAWAAERTGGVIGRVRVEPAPDTSLVVASALLLGTDWDVPFEGHFGSWLGRHDRAGLVREVMGLDGVAVARTAAGAVTRVVCCAG